MKKIIVIARNLQEFKDFVIKTGRLRKEKFKLSLVNGTVEFKDFKFLYSNDPERLRGIERGTEYFFTGNQDHLIWGNHPVLERFKKIDHV